MKILYVTTVGITMCFFKSFIRQLIDEGHEVHIATNETESMIPNYYREWGCRIFSLSCSRTPLNKGNLKSIGEIKKLVKEKGYDLVHCHTPIAAACTRLACSGLRKNGVKVLYTAHGFHFYNGAPIKNWLIYYPIEKLCAYFTDVLITINQEDYALALKRFKAKKVIYVPGVGVDFDQFSVPEVGRNEKREALGIPEDATILLSVGEVNDNKNHQVIISAMHLLADENVHYLIAGRGGKTAELKHLAASLGLEERVHFLGFRSDIPELCLAADVFCFPSKREGLGLASLEAMSFGLPLLTSNVHGINDYSESGVTGYKYAPLDAAGFAEGMKKLIDKPEIRKEMGEHNRNAVKKYSISNVLPIMQDLYKSTQN